MATDLSKATPRPWKDEGRFFAAADRRYGQSVGEVLIARMERHRLGRYDRVPPDDIQEANVAFILRAVNAYDDMLAALQRLLAPMASWGGCSYCAPGFGLQWHDPDCPVTEARAAIDKAKGP